MELNSLFFPAPESSYTYKSLKGKLVFIPRAPIAKSLSNFKTHADFGFDSHYIPCLYLKHASGSSKILVYFHGNAEDVGSSELDMEELGDLLGVHVFVVEYPGYGIYAGEPGADRVLEDAINVFDYLAYECEWGESNIILFGRSIGTGPAVHLASHKRPSTLFLVSPYTSVRGIVRSMLGSAMQYLVKERFNNLELIAYVHCPTMIIHGRNDTLIPYAHASALKSACTRAPCELILNEHMDHNEASFYDDIESPFMDFIAKYKVMTEATPTTNALPRLPIGVYFLPTKFPPASGPGLITKFIYNVSK